MRPVIVDLDALLPMIDSLPELPRKRLSEWFAHRCTPVERCVLPRGFEQPGTWREVRQ
jgi:hypothetical protein